MRIVLTLLATAAFGPALFVQESTLRDEPVPRFGIPALTGLYPQTSPKLALESTIKAIERERFDYVVAHLLDESFVETRVGKRAVELLPAVEADLRDRRDRQRQNPAAVNQDEKLSMEPRAFAAACEAEARSRAYRVVVKDVKDKLVDDPEGFKELRRFARDGTLAETGDAATITLRDVKERKVYLMKRANGRWFIENKQAEAGK